MRKATALALLILGLAQIGPAARAAGDDDNYCPEEDIVRVCLQAMTSTSAVEDWAKKNQRKWSTKTLPLNQSQVNIRMPVFGWFGVSSLPLGDTLHMTCTMSVMLPANPGKTARCDPAFPMIAKTVPENATRFTVTLDRGYTVNSWYYEQLDWRIQVSVTSTPDGDATDWYVSRIKVAPR